MKPCTFLTNPDGERVLHVEAPIQTRETLEALTGAQPFERLDCIPLRAIDQERELVLIRRASPGASLNEASAYQVGGHRVLGRALICTRPKTAEDIPNFLTADPQVGFAPLTSDEASVLVQWSAPVTGELSGRMLDVAMLDAYAKFFCERAGAAAFGQVVVRLYGIDQAARPAVAFNVPAGDWRAFRRAALDLYDRRWSVIHEWVLREAPQVRGGNDETAPVFEVAEIKTKPGGHAFTCYGADAKEVFGVIHADPIRGTKLLRRSHRAVAVPGLPLFVGDSGVPILPDWQIAG